MHHHAVHRRKRVDRTDPRVRVWGRHIVQEVVLVERADRREARVTPGKRGARDLHGERIAIAWLFKNLVAALVEECPAGLALEHL